MIVAVNRIHRGRAITLVGRRLPNVVERMKRQVPDVEVEVRFPREQNGAADAMSNRAIDERS
jgi:hypothetical protein